MTRGRDAATAATPRPPVAAVVPATSVVHGEVRVDPYAWLRDKDDPAVLGNLHAENAYTEAMMVDTEGLQETLYHEILGRIQETDLSVPERKDDWWYYTRTEAGKAYPIYCRKRGSLEAPEEVLLDVNALAAGRSFMEVGPLAVSPDHRLLAYGVDVSGYERYTVRIRDLATGEHLPDALDDVDASLAWADDNATLFYTTHDAAHRPYRLYRHRLGEAQAADDLVLEERDARFRVYARRTRSGAFVLVTVNSTRTSECHVLDTRDPAAAPRVIQPREEGVEYAVEHHGARFYVTTNADGAVNFKLMAADVDRPSRAHWETVIAHRPDVKLDGVEAFAGHLVIRERAAGLPRLRVRDMATGAEHVVEHPEPAYGVWVQGNREFATTTLRFLYSSLVTPMSVFDYDMASRARALRKETVVPSGYDRTRYACARLTAPAPDGVAVPISIVYRTDFARDGSRPLWLYGYGSYGVAVDPTFNPARLSLLDRGFAFAIAHVRGGGELGRPWYDDGRFLRKHNTFTDFIACAEHLIREGYTAPERLVISGGSAGGLLMGAVVNLRPDLFRCVVAKVPFVDVVNTMLDASIPLTVGEYEEWGDPADPAYYACMRSYAPYDNVRAADYPAMLVTAGLNDPRVHFWEPAKWVARLRATKTDDRRLLLRTQMTAGHGGPSGRYDVLREMAFEYAFVLEELGLGDG